MKHFTLFMMLLLPLMSTQAQAAEDAACPAYLDQDMRRLGSSEVVNLCDAYFGKPIMVINTASFCG